MISNVLINTDFKLKGLREKYKGKVRDVYKLKNNLLIETKQSSKKLKT